MIHRRGDLGRVNRPVFRLFGVLVTGTNDLAAAYSAARQEHAPNAGPMIAAAAVVQLGGTAKLAHA